MKKSLLVLALFIAAIFAATALVGCNKQTEEEKGFVIGIISDPQIVAASDVGDDDYASFQDFNAVGQKMLFISEAILKTAVDRLIEKKVDVVLIPGDLTENGSKVGHVTVAAECARLEAAGIQTYVVCGNHDINKSPKRYLTKEDALAQGLTIYEEFEDGSCSVKVPGVSPEEFTNIFYEYGFKDAVAQDTLENPVVTTVEGRSFEEVGTMSYVQDLAGSDYRLISIDASNYYEDENENTYYVTYYGSGKNRSAAIKGTGYSVMTYRLLDWIETQLKAAKEEGKKPLAMAHFPVNNQMGDVVGLITDGIDNRMNLADELLDLFARYGVEYVFTGHLHTQHTATYRDPATDATVTDVETGCLTNYPLPIRYVSFKNDGVSIENEYVSAVKEEYLPNYLDDPIVKKAVTSELQNYALYPFIYDNLLRNFDERINDGGEYALFYKVFDILSLDKEGTHEEELASLADYIYNDLYMAFMKMPLYEKDKKPTDRLSLESICAKYDVTLPPSEYTSVFEFFIKLLGKFYKYDYANDGGPITYEGKEGTILRYGVYSIFEVLRSSELFARLHSINEALPEVVFGENFVRKLYAEDTLDLLCDDFISNVLVFVQPLVENYVKFKSLQPETIVKALKAALPLGLYALSIKLPGIYDRSEDAIFGVPVDEIMTIDVLERNDEDVPVMEIYFDVLLKDVVFEKIGNGILN